jgi:hypothetical protein
VQQTSTRSPEYGIQHGAECVHDVVQTAKNYSAMRLHYSAGKLHGWFTNYKSVTITTAPTTVTSAKIHHKLHPQPTASPSP